jgi:hypothetical protein
MPAPNSEHVLDLLQQLVDAPSWGATRRIVEAHPELLTEEADAVLARFQDAYRDDPEVWQFLNERRDLLRRCREDGIEAAFAGLEAEDDDPEARAARERQTDDALIEAVHALIQAQSPAEVLDVVQAHPLLLSDQADAALRYAIERAERMGREGMVRHMEERYHLVRQMREQGVDARQVAALAEAQAQMAAAVAELPAPLQEALTEASSPEELEALVAEHPALADVLVQGVGTLSNRDKDPRVEMIYAFINTDTWLDTMRVVQDHPELLSDETDELFALMLTQAEAAADARTARILREHHELLRRCRAVGVEAAFAEKIECCPASTREKSPRRQRSAPTGDDPGDGSDQCGDPELAD